MDVSWIIDVLAWGAAAAKVHAGSVGMEVAKIAATEVVKETTKEAYKAARGSVVSIFGRKAERAIALIEDDPASTAAKDQIKEAIASVPEEDEAELADKFFALLTALKSDSAASPAREVARVSVDVESEADVTIERVRNARTLDVKSKSKGNFVLRDIDMDPGRDQGN